MCAGCGLHPCDTPPVCGSGVSPAPSASATDAEGHFTRSTDPRRGSALADRPSGARRPAIGRRSRVTRPRTRGPQHEHRRSLPSDEPHEGEVRRKRPASRGEGRVAAGRGLDYHVLFGPEGDMKVSEIWDSQEQLEAFGEVLMPILLGTREWSSRATQTSSRFTTSTDASRRRHCARPDQVVVPPFPQTIRTRRLTATARHTTWSRAARSDAIFANCCSRGEPPDRPLQPAQ